MEHRLRARGIGEFGARLLERLLAGLRVNLDLLTFPLSARALSNSGKVFYAGRSGYDWEIFLPVGATFPVGSGENLSLGLTFDPGVTFSHDGSANRGKGTRGILFDGRNGGSFFGR